MIRWRRDAREDPARGGSILLLLLVGAVILSFGARMIEPHLHDLDRSHDSAHCPICWLAQTPVGLPSTIDACEAAIDDNGTSVAEPVVIPLGIVPAGPAFPRGPPLC